MESRHSRENSLRKGSNNSAEDGRSIKSHEEKRLLVKRGDSFRETRSEGDSSSKKVQGVDRRKHIGSTSRTLVNFAEDQEDHLEKRESLREISNKGEVVQKKFISTWKLACDRTRDRTKELLRKWRSVPEDHMSHPPEETPHHGSWSVHVWTTWVKRYPSEDDGLTSDEHNSDSLTPTQKEKLSHFFSHAFDTDRDEIISLQDFESFTERLRHFADWTSNSGEYLILLQVQQGFVQTFLTPPQIEKDDINSDEAMVIDPYKHYLSLDDWFWLWSRLLDGVKSSQEFPVWLQYFPRVIFQAINKSGSGRITRDELSAFYSSVMGFSAQRVGEIIDEAFKAMTANGDCTLNLNVYKLCFANMLLGRYPNGPGQYLFGSTPQSPAMFPIDYTAMNTAPEDREQYTLDGKSNRRSVVV